MATRYAPDHREITKIMAAMGGAELDIAGDPSLVYEERLAASGLSPEQVAWAVANTPAELARRIRGWQQAASPRRPGGTGGTGGAGGAGGAGDAGDAEGAGVAQGRQGARADALSADEAAAFLGVKKQTLYVYVTRGLVRTVRRPGGNVRGYLREDLLRLKARGDVRAGRPPSAVGALHYGQPVIDSSITLIDVERGPVYRGHAAVELARGGVAFEQVARLLWGGTGAGGGIPANAARFVPSNAKLARFKLVADAPSPVQRIEAALFLLGRDLPRYAMLDERRLAEGVMGTVQSVLQPCIGAEPGVAVQRACVVAADHELNPSTFAARVAASTGAGLVPSLQAALAAFSGPKHGGACDRIEALLDEIGRPGRAREVVEGRMARGEEVPGFFSGIYRHADPRSAVLLELPELARPAAATARALIDAVREVGGTGGPGPSIDLAFVALGRALGWPRGTATALFAAARMAGWIAHVFEQRASGEILRPRARFVSGPGAGA